MHIGGEVDTDSDGNPDPSLGLILNIHENREIELRYVTNGKTGWKEITMPVDGKMVCGVYGRTTGCSRLYHEQSQRFCSV